MSIVDVLTDQSMVVLQDRSVVPLSGWMVRALHDCADSGRALQLVTPLESRLTLALRSLAAADGAGGVQWVVRHGDGYYEGLSGRPLMWAGSAFAPVPDARDYAPGFTTRPSAPIGSQLTLTYRVRHTADGYLHGPLERLMQLLTGKYPVGWGPAEPMEHPWQPDRFTEYVRGRERARLMIGGDGPRPAQAVAEFATVQGCAVAENTTVSLGYGPDDPPPLQHLPQLVGGLAADQPVVSLFVQLTPGRADLTTEPRWSGAAAPVAMAVAGTVTGPPTVPGRQVGPANAPMTLFPLGDGRSPEGWQRHRALVHHLQGG
ncbi:DUF6177 family protein [Actinomadura kijaniata]|uniref:DUF6177 family protein n=1 Tax=Actinomadura kijaniata TaxID=46161 RepID=UPI003F1AA4F4